MAKTIILIDDDPDDLFLLKESIGKIDPTLLCISFIYAEEAVELLSRELLVLPEYIFIDINMPKKTGTECLVDLRKNGELKNVPIIMCSTSMPETVSRNLLSLGANFTFQKPFTVNEYLITLRKILR